MAGKSKLSELRVRAAKGLAAIGGAVVALGAAGGVATADDNISIYSFYFFVLPRPFLARSSITACAAANRAIGTRKGDALT